MFRGYRKRPFSSPCFPRIRGDVPSIAPPDDAYRPFSPHTRGCSAMCSAWARIGEVFPAYAGMFRVATVRAISGMSFPRIRGDVPSSMSLPVAARMFSPHTRGCSCAYRCRSCWLTVFPAYAGMFPGTYGLPGRGKGFPRIRGDVPAYRWKARIPPAFSPHTRGYSRGKACNEEDSSEKYSQQGSLFSFQTFRSGDHIKLAPTFTKPKVDFLCPN